MAGSKRARAWRGAGWLKLCAARRPQRRVSGLEFGVAGLELSVAGFELEVLCCKLDGQRTCLFGALDGIGRQREHERLADGQRRRSGARAGGPAGGWAGGRTSGQAGRRAGE